MGIKQTQDLSRKTNGKEQLGRPRIKWKYVTKMNLKNRSWLCVQQWTLHDQGWVAENCEFESYL